MWRVKVKSQLSTKRMIVRERSPARLQTYNNNNILYIIAFRNSAQRDSVKDGVRGLTGLLALAAIMTAYTVPHAGAFRAKRPTLMRQGRRARRAWKLCRRPAGRHPQLRHVFDIHFRRLNRTKCV